MDFTRMELEELKITEIKNGIIVLTNGVGYFKDLPDFGKTNLTITNANGKALYIEEETKVKTKL